MSNEYRYINKIKQSIQEIISLAIADLFNNSDISQFDIKIEVPKDESHGDYSTNIAMILSKKLGKNPVEIANEIVQKINESEEIDSANVAGPGFINTILNEEAFSEGIYAIANNHNLYAQVVKENKIIEFSSPNIAKPFTIGHLRSTIIGDSIARLNEEIGMQVFRDNHLGDWGASFGKYLAAFDLYKIDLDKLLHSERPIKELVDLYIRFNSDIEKNENLKELGREWFKKLEDGDQIARNYWQKCIDISFVEFKRIYDLLDIHFTENNGRGYGEAFFEDEMKHVIEDLHNANKEGLIDFKMNDGAWLIFFDKADKLPPLMILKSNGTTLYSTRDLATDRFRMNHTEYGHPELTVVNEVGNEQKLYWQQLFKVEELLGWYKQGKRIHIGHGLYKFKDGKMSTRKGNVIWLEDILNQSIEQANQIALENGENLSDEEIKEISHVVGIGAIKWNDLKRDRNIDVLFDWDEMLNIKGDSAPYIQYTYARAKSIVRQYGSFNLNDKGFSFKQFQTEEERNLMKLINEFPQVVYDSAVGYAPNFLCNYIYDLAQAFNKFYNKHSVLNAEKDLKEARVFLTNTTAEVIKKGLSLLGIKTVEKM